MAKKSAASGLQTPPVLAFERKLDPSDALFSAGVWSNIAAAEQWPMVPVREKIVRGTISNRLKNHADAKLDADIENPNLQTVDVAALPSQADTLQVRFTLRVLPGLGTPSACSYPDYRVKLAQVVTEYVKQIGLLPIAQRYAYNLANGRFLWRNRIGAEQIQVQVRQLRDGKPLHHWTFDAQALSLREFTSTPDVDALASVMAAGLAGEQHVLLEIAAFVRMGAGQEVFPSQELVMEKGDKKKGQKSKTLYVVNCRIPSDHIPIRSWPLFLARELMRDLIETLKAEQST